MSATRTAAARVARRRDAIVRFLSREHALTAEELATYTGAGVGSVRRDLDALVAEGRVKLGGVSHTNARCYLAVVTR